MLTFVCYPQQISSDECPSSPLEHYGINTKQRVASRLDTHIAAFLVDKHGNTMHDATETELVGGDSPNKSDGRKASTQNPASNMHEESRPLPTM